MSSQDRPTRTHRAEDGTPVSWDDAVHAWAGAAREILEGVARSYGSWITYGALADRVQGLTGIHTTQLIHYWIGSVLAEVVRAQPPEEPILSALVVQSNGTIGSGFRIVVEERGHDAQDIEAFAAHERLACHRHFGAELPPGGGGPVHTRRIVRAIRQQKQDGDGRPARLACRRRGEARNVEIEQFRDHEGRTKVRVTYRLIAHEEPVVTIYDAPDG